MLNLVKTLLISNRLPICIMICYRMTAVLIGRHQGYPLRSWYDWGKRRRSLTRMLMNALAAQCWEWNIISFIAHLIEWSRVKKRLGQQLCGIPKSLSNVVRRTHWPERNASRCQFLLLEHLSSVYYLCSKHCDIGILQGSKTVLTCTCFNWCCTIDAKLLTSQLEEKQHLIWCLLVAVWESTMKNLMAFSDHWCFIWKPA